MTSPDLQKGFIVRRLTPLCKSPFQPNMFWPVELEVGPHVAHGAADGAGAAAFKRIENRTGVQRLVWYMFHAFIR